MTSLPTSIENQIIAIFDVYMHGAIIEGTNLKYEIAPGMQGKQVFIEQLYHRNDFLPEEIQREVDKLRGDIDTVPYLFKQMIFGLKFSKYLTTELALDLEGELIKSEPTN